MEMVAIPDSQFFRLSSKSKEKHEKIKESSIIIVIIIINS